MSTLLIQPRLGISFTHEEGIIALFANSYLGSEDFLTYLNSIMVVANQIVETLKNSGSGSNFYDGTVCGGASLEMEAIVQDLCANPDELKWMRSDLMLFSNHSLPTQFIGDRITCVMPQLVRYHDVNSCEKSTSLANGSARPPISANRGFYFYEDGENRPNGSFAIARKEVVLSAAPFVCDESSVSIEHVTQDVLNATPAANFSPYYFWEEAARCARAVIMLSRVELNKAERYWPLSGESLTFTIQEKAPICVSSLGETIQDEIDVRKFSVTHQGKISIHSHYLVKNWENRDVVESSLFSTIINIAKIVRDPIIHCSAGIGRTGVVYVGLQLESFLKGFFALRIWEEFNSQSSLNAAAHRALNAVQYYLRPFVQGVIVCARKQRNTSLVETIGQENFLVQYAAYLVSQIAAKFGLQ